MDLYARINILGGLSVRLPRGGLDEAIALDNDPIGRARNWVKQGIDYLHVVDLDAAAYGDYRNRELISRMIEEIEIPVQVAGGIRSEAEAQKLLETGAWRIVMGTAAIENQIMVWEMCRDNPDKIVVSLDVRQNEEVVTRGWTQNSGRFLEEVLIEMSSAGAVAFLVSEAGRNALTDPPNLQIMAEALATVEEPVVAAGGVRDLEDLRKLMLLETSGRHLSGVIVGREVTAGRFTIAEAKEVLAGGGPKRAPGGVTTTRTAVGVASLETALGFYRDVLGFHQVRSPSAGVSAAVVEAGPGQHIELVEGGASRPDSLVFKVEDLERWKLHLANAGLDTAADGARLVMTDPDGLQIVLE
ncbi:MAG TPA: HisA/HisF-related TIM barrel protein [Acidimicrobiia bacterium]|jgi:phosphoribosylformimino-5-aminoimidazole carboxamide ribotide isomerase|nr:HisA/HisF-related TIM barrel protein [Acidimicrobiia bacterium]